MDAVFRLLHTVALGDKKSLSILTAPFAPYYMCCISQVVEVGAKCHISNLHRNHRNSQNIFRFVSKCEMASTYLNIQLTTLGLIAV